jgi:hypothetical protein
LAVRERHASVVDRLDARAWALMRHQRPSPGGGSSGGGSSGGNDTSGPIPNAISNLGPKKADSLPVPLLVLGGVAIVLMAAGGAGFLARRTRTRRAQLASAASVPHGPGPEPTEQS